MTIKEKPLRFLRDQKYMVFDFETCNLNLSSPSNKPWQLAYQIYKGRNLIESKDFYIKWDNLKLSEGAKRVTGFNQEKYNSISVNPKEVLSSFEKHLYDKDCISLGHNILGFDIYIHNIFRKLLGLTTDYSYTERCIDTFCLSKAINSSIEVSKSEDFPSWQFKLNSLRLKGVKLNLGACCKKYQIDFDPSKLHDALYDIKKNFEVFQKMIWEIDV